MSKLSKPEGYHALLDLKQTEMAIKKIKDFFLSSLSTELRLRRVTAPLFVLRGLGINDDLNGVERPVSFPIKDMGESVAEVVHSLAKWKRLTLAEYEIAPGFGIVTDMNAIRADEELDNLHSLYVDQWDWERVLRREDRNLAYLKKKGYPVQDGFNAILSELIHRLAANRDFPHEVGLFLGYPLVDVIGFESDRSAFKYAGFWKVYGDRNKAVKQMMLYKTCTKVCMANLGKGMSVPLAAKEYIKVKRVQNLAG